MRLANPALVTAFRDWFQTHRGAKEPTLRHYTRGATESTPARSARMSVNGMRKPYETFFCNEPANVALRQHRS